MKTISELTVIGWREWVSLPALAIPHIKAKIDTGARTSALHAFSVESYKAKDDSEWVRFGMHPVQDDQQTEVWCEAPIKDRRVVRDSGGHETERIVIDTEVCVGDTCFIAEVTLTDRDNMLFRMLLGRTAMNGRFVVDPQRSFLCGSPDTGTSNDES